MFDSMKTRFMCMLMAASVALGTISFPVQVWADDDDEYWMDDLDDLTPEEIKFINSLTDEDGDDDIDEDDVIASAITLGIINAAVEDAERQQKAEAERRRKAAEEEAARKAAEEEAAPVIQDTPVKSQDFTPRSDLINVIDKSHVGRPKTLKGTYKPISARLKMENYVFARNEGGKYGGMNAYINYLIEKDIKRNRK